MNRNHIYIYCINMLMLTQCHLKILNAKTFAKKNTCSWDIPNLFLLQNQYFRWHNFLDLMFKVEPTGPFCSQQTSLFQLPQWFPESHPNLWQEITLTRLFLEPVTSPVTNRGITVACWWIGWHSQHTSCLLFVVLLAVNPMWLLFFQSFICELCVCHFWF